MTRAFHAAILAYHAISEGSAPLCIAPHVFAPQMSWIKTNAHVVSLAKLVESLVCGLPLPLKTVALTFDDGFCRSGINRLQTAVAFPLLRQRFVNYVAKTSQAP
jgi:hypothetical protein